MFWCVVFSFYLQISSKFPCDFFFDLLVVEELIIFTFWWIFLFSLCRWFLVPFYMKKIFYMISASQMCENLSCRLHVVCGKNILRVLEKTVFCCLEGNVLYMSIKSNWSNCAVKVLCFLIDLLSSCSIHS